MSFRQTILVGWFLILVAFGVALWFYPQLPNPVPTHWDVAGHINGYTPKPWGVILMPLVMIGLWLVLWVLPAISPKGFRLDSFLPVYGIISLAILAVMFVIMVITLLAARGSDLPMQRIAPIVIGLLLLVLGNYFGKIRKNFFIGIRTPWTLASDEVWRRTHHLGGWLFVIGGLIIAAAGLVAPAHLVTGILIAVVIAISVITVGGSYFIYRRLEGFTNGNGQN